MSVIAGSVFNGGADRNKLAGRLLGSLDFVLAEREAEWKSESCVLVTRRLIVETGDATAPLLKPTAAGIVLADRGPSLQSIGTRRVTRLAHAERR